MKAPGEEEKAIKGMDDNSGASLKLTILNPQGLIWTLVAGGGASVVYADTLADLIGAGEPANYGEYSGNLATRASVIASSHCATPICASRVLFGMHGPVSRRPGCWIMHRK